MERKCIVCKKDNPNPRSMFCSSKCKQQYYYQKNKEQRAAYKKEHYQEHKEEYVERAMDWKKKNRDRWNEFQKNYIKLVRAKAKEEAEENE